MWESEGVGVLSQNGDGRGSTKLSTSKASVNHAYSIPRSVINYLTRSGVKASATMTLGQFDGSDPVQQQKGKSYAFVQYLIYLSHDCWNNSSLQIKELTVMG